MPSRALAIHHCMPRLRRAGLTYAFLRFVPMLCDFGLWLTPQLISFLIVHGAKLNLVDINNQTAKQLAMDEVRGALPLTDV